MLTSHKLHLMGTFIEISIWHEDPQPILDQVEQLLYLYKDRFSANDLTSELLEVNLNAGVQAVPVSQDLYDLIRLGKEHSCAQDSYLNIAIGPLTQAWKIGFEDAQVPDELTLSHILEKIDPQDIELEETNRLVYLKKTGMSIDLGALAKGFIADLVISHLKRIRVTQGIINLGGNVQTLGKAQHNTNKVWNIGIQNPKLPRGNNIALLQLEEGSVVTSGIYERTFQWEGKTYHHIFDSQTGYPITSDIASLTILSPTSIEGEIWSSRLFGHSTSTIYHTINKLDNIEAVIITKTNDLLYTDGLSEKITLLMEKKSPTTDTDTSLFLEKIQHNNLPIDTVSGASVH